MNNDLFITEIKSTYRETYVLNKNRKWETNWK